MRGIVYPELACAASVPKRCDAGDLYIAAAEPTSPMPSQRSLLAVKQELAGFSQGDGPIRRIIVPVNPTLDDMLAASFCARMLAGWPLPTSSGGFARYAAMVRQGLQPSDLPLGSTMEGIFMAIRASLDKKHVAACNPVFGEVFPLPERFVADWWRMSNQIMPAIDRDADPLTSRLFDEGTEFAAHKAYYLTNDHKVFLEDVARGEQWVVDVPNSASSGRAIVLLEPKSTLYIFFCRSNQDAPGGRAFDLVIVKLSRQRWKIFTGPVRHISLQGLSEVLKTAEKARRPADAFDNPLGRTLTARWWDGSAFEHKLIDSPTGGTALSDKQVLDIVRRWSNGRPEKVASRPRQAVLSGVAAALLALGIGCWFARDYMRQDFGAQRPAALTDDEIRGLQMLAVSDARAVEPRMGKDYALLVGIEKYDRWPPLQTPSADVMEAARLLSARYGFEIMGGKPLLNPTCEQVRDSLDALDKKDYSAEDQLLIWIAGHGAIYQRKGYLVGRDAEPTVGRPDSRTYLSFDDFGATIDKLKCPHVFLLVDTCYGGTIDTQIALGEELSPLPKRERGGAPKMISKGEYIRRKLVPWTRRCLTSGGNESVPDGDIHSPFADCLLRAFEGGGGSDGILTLGELDEYVSKLLPQPQDMRLSRDQRGSDFLLVRRDWPK